MHATPSNPNQGLPRRIKTALTTLAGLLLGAGLAGGAIYVRIPHLKGDVTTEGYNDGNWIEAFSGTYGVERDLVEANEDGTASLHIGIGRLLPIGMACQLNAGAGPLAQAAVSGETVGDVEIHLVDLEPDPVTFSIIKLRHANVKDFTMETADTGRPWYQAFFVYREIEIINKLSSPTGQEEQTVYWNLETNTDSPLVVSAEMQTWLDAYFTPQQQADPGIGGLTADVDNDGLNTVQEFKFNLDPWNPNDGHGIVQHWMVDAGGEQYLQISFVQRTDASTPLTHVEVEVGDDLQTWNSGATEVVLMSSTPLGDDLEEVVYRLVRPRSEKPKQFTRLSVIHNGGTP